MDLKPQNLTAKTFYREFNNNNSINNNNNNSSNNNNNNNNNSAISRRGWRGEWRRTDPGTVYSYIWKSSDQPLGEFVRANIMYNIDIIWNNI